ncbi:MAG: hypothetical protein LBL97_00405 [Prevotellaceae bacterium]|jgi:hypothetical protein|nr:hypothetical protein [Prevotellaceae bacterium]
MKHLKYVLFIMKAIVLLSSSCASWKNIENCEIQRVIVITDESDDLYYLRVKFNSCASKELRENLVKEELRNRFPLIGNKTIYVEEYPGKLYNEYNYKIKVGGVSLSGQIIDRKVGYFVEIPTELLSQLDKMGTDSTLILNEYEGKYLNFIFSLDAMKFNLIGKRVAFCESKTDFFKYERDWHYRGNERGVGGTILYIFTAEQKVESGGYDAAVAYWKKLAIPIEKVVERLRSKLVGKIDGSETNTKDKPLLTIVDGLRLNGDFLRILALNIEEVRSVVIDGEKVMSAKIDASATYEEDGVRYQGVVSFKTKLLFVVNGKLLHKQRDKQAVLSKIKQREIVALQRISAADASQRWGRAGRYGAVIITL